MTDLDEENTIKNRILLRESYIRKLTSKYLDLISKFNLLTRSEMTQIIKEILNEIDMISINSLKAENLEKLKDLDSEYLKKVGSEIGKNFLNKYF